MFSFLGCKLQIERLTAPRFAFSEKMHLLQGTNKVKLLTRGFVTSVTRLVLTEFSSRHNQYYLLVCVHFLDVNRFHSDSSDCERALRAYRHCQMGRAPLTCSGSLCLYQDLSIFLFAKLDWLCVRVSACESLPPPARQNSCPTN